MRCRCVCWYVRHVCACVSPKVYVWLLSRATCFLLVRCCICFCIFIYYIILCCCCSPSLTAVAANCHRRCRLPVCSCFCYSVCPSVYLADGHAYLASRNQKQHNTNTLCFYPVNSMAKPARSGGSSSSQACASTRGCTHNL